LKHKTSAVVGITNTKPFSLDVDAAGAFQDFIDSVEAEVVDLLAGDDGDALRGFAGGKGNLAGSGSRAGGVGAGVFGEGVPFALGGNGDGGEGSFFLCGRSRCFGLGLDGGGAILLGEQ
jgi:hypothetical protein